MCCCERVNISHLSPIRLVACAFRVCHRLLAIPDRSVSTGGPKPRSPVLRKGPLERQRRSDAYDTILNSQSAAVIAQVLLFCAPQTRIQRNTRRDAEPAI